MKVTVSKPKKSEVTITIEVDDKELEKYREQAAKELSKQVKIPGFRPGKVPKDILEKHIGKEQIHAYAIDLGLPHFYADAVLKENVQVVARPDVKILEEGPLKFEAVVAILPEVEIKGYENIKIKKDDTKVEDKDVQEVLDHFMKQHAEYTEAKRAAKMGDRVEMDFEGFDLKGDVPLEGTASKNHPVVLGEGSLIPGFEEEVVGLKAGDEKTFEITFPKDYHSKKFQDKKVKFKIKVHKVEEVKLPELTKDFIKEKIGEDKSPEELKKQIKENLEKERERNVNIKRENEFFDKLADLAKVDIPGALIEEEIDFILDRTKMDLQSRGLGWEQYEKYLQSQGRNIREEKEPQATKQVKLRLILQHLYKVEKIEASDKEVENRIDEILAQYPKDQHDAIKAEYKPGKSSYAQIQNSIYLEKFLDKFLK